MSKQKQKNNFCTQHVLNLYIPCNSMNNLLSYCGLTDAILMASEKDLLVRGFWDLKKIAKIPLFHVHKPKPHKCTARI